jgi:polyferredoxin
MMAWLVIGTIQTFVIIPLIVWRWGKGAYCGWICSCGALAETMGDTHRHKMPHGPTWNRLAMLGQVFLWIATILLLLRVITWILPGTNWIDTVYNTALAGRHANGAEIGGVMRYLNFAWIDDLLWAGIFGVCFYFWFSGRIWCRFACPLAALMHIYARFSRFRIIAEKKKCISCNVCTSVCHQGIDIMNFANKGLPMEDPQCVRCSACVQSCPTGVLQFGRVNRAGEVVALDRLAASAVVTAEASITPRSRDAPV